MTNHIHETTIFSPSNFYLEFESFDIMYVTNYESQESLCNGTLTPDVDSSTLNGTQGSPITGPNLLKEKDKRSVSSGYSSSNYSQNFNNSFQSVADCIRESFLNEISNNQDLARCQNYIYSLQFNGNLCRNMQSTSLVREWSSPLKKTVTGEPPNSAVRPETIRSEERQKDVRVVTPFFKSKASPESMSKESEPVRPAAVPVTRVTNGSPDYKVEQSQEHYRLHIIDPKVDSHANIPVHPSTLPSTYRKRNKTPDFPSAHSKRSFLKLDPLEPRRLRSVEIRPITTTDYLSESLDRHRAMVSSPLKQQLKVNERDVNRPWDKPGRPGPKVPCAVAVAQSNLEEGSRRRNWDELPSTMKSTLYIDTSRRKYP